MRTTRILFLGMMLAIAGPAIAASPFDPVRIVNGQVITEYDVAERVKLLDALGAEDNLRALAIDQLTEDRVKVFEAEVLGIELPEDAIVAGLEQFGAQRGLTLDQVLDVLDEAEIDPAAMDDFVEAGLLWSELLGARFREQSIPTDDEVARAVREAENATILVYQLAEIALPFAERGEAETEIFARQLYAELQRGFDFEVAARRFSRAPSAENGGLVEPIPQANLPPPLRAELERLSPGQVSEPIPITGGIAILKLVSIRNVRPEPDPTLTEFDRTERARQQLFSQRVTAFGEGYLQELLLDAVIVDP
jgi:peptidyl-prolyl cis-trans isomerase SurA